jgi:hypothetical protein
MAQLIVLPYSTSILYDIHNVVTRGLGKTRLIANDLDEALDAHMAAPDETELMVVDFSWLRAFGPCASGPNYPKLKDVPVIVMQGSGVSAVAAYERECNIVASLPVKHQYDSYLPDLYKAFFACKEALPADTRITKKHFGKQAENLLKQPMRNDYNIYQILAAADEVEPSP